MPDQWSYCDATGEQPTAAEIQRAAMKLARLKRRKMVDRFIAAIRHINEHGDQADAAAWLDLLWLTRQVARDRGRRAMIDRLFARLEAAGAIVRIDRTKR